MSTRKSAAYLPAVVLSCEADRMDALWPALVETLSGLSPEAYLALILVVAASGGRSSPRSSLSTTSVSTTAGTRC